MLGQDQDPEDDEEALEPDEILSMEEDAARFARNEPLTHYPSLPTRWAWQRTLVEDAQQSRRYGPVLLMLDVIKQHEGRLSEWPGICMEVFSFLYSDNKKDTVVEFPSELAWSLKAWLESTSSWEQLRSTCRGRRAIAMTSAAKLCHSLAHEILDLGSFSQDPKKAKSPEDYVAEARALIEGGTSEEAVAKVYDPLLEASEERRAQLIKALDRSSGAGQAKFAMWSNMMSTLLGIAQELGVLQDMLRQCGLGPSLQEAHDPVSLELLKALRALPHLKDLFSLVGRMQRAAKGTLGPSKVRIRPEGIERTQHDLLLEEFVLDEVEEDLWLQRFVDKQTLGLKRVGEEPLNSGDAIFVLDDSGSMMGKPAEWGRAFLAAGVLEALASDRRALAAIYSDVRYGGYHDAEILTPSDLPDLFQLLDKSLKGGTETRAALLRAASKLKAPLREPDIVLLTDGEWEDLKEEDFEALKGPDGNGRLYVILLGVGHREIPGAERVWAIKELDIETVKEVLQAIRRKEFE